MCVYVCGCLQYSFVYVGTAFCYETFDPADQLAEEANSRGVQTMANKVSEDVATREMVRWWCVLLRTKDNDNDDLIVLV